MSGWLREENCVAADSFLLHVWRTIAAGAFEELPANSTESAHALRPFYYRSFSAEAAAASLVTPQPTKWHMRAKGMDLGPLPTTDATTNRACGVLEAKAAEIRADEALAGERELDLEVLPR